MLEKAKISFASATAMLLLAGPAAAKLPADQVARLGADLTPVGAERAGNADGSIPEWTGGIRSAAEAGFPGFKTGGHHPDPYASDKIKFTINKSNMAQYADKLTEGHKAMLNTYDSFFMNVYPTRRSAAATQQFYDATKAAAANAVLTGGGNGVTGGVGGVPFPIPASGVEVIWNHIMRFRGINAARNIGQAALTRGGDYTLVKFQDEFKGIYFEPGMTEEGLGNVILYFKQKITAPARLAGQILLVHETLDQTKEIRKAWLYNPGQRRVRRAPNVAFDNPRDGSDGLATSDQFDMYNGSPQRYDWKLVGKKEIYVPYNSYKLHSSDLKYDQILTPLHINPNLPRYELHRVWVVDATLKEGTRHIYKRRTFYVDEDSWQILAMDQYDNRDQLWRVSEGFVINYYDVPNIWTTLESHVDLQSGRYVVLGLNNEESSTYDFSPPLTLADFTPAALRRDGTR